MNVKATRVAIDERLVQRILEEGGHLCAHGLTYQHLQGAGARRRKRRSTIDISQPRFFLTQSTQLRALLPMVGRNLKIGQSVTPTPRRGQLLTLDAGGDRPGC